MTEPLRRRCRLKVDRIERFRVIYETHLGRVHAYARRRAGAEDAKEVVADTFVVAWRRLDDVPEDALPWLLAVARGLLANQRRGARRRLALDGKLMHETSHDVLQADDPEGRVIADDALRRALERLPAWDREVLTLVAWERLDNRRAARVMGCSPATFGVRLHRARRRLAALLAADETPPPAPARHAFEEVK